MRRKGVALFFSAIIIMVIVSMGALMLSQSVSESTLTQKFTESTQAFWVAEAGIHHAFDELRLPGNFNQSGEDLWNGSIGQGEYSVDVEANGNQRLITSHGYIPDEANQRVHRQLGAVILRVITNLYNNAIYCANDVIVNEVGKHQWEVDGDVRYAGNLTDDFGEVSESEDKPDYWASPLPEIDFERVYNISQTQGNYYDEDRLYNVSQGWENFPEDFWYGGGEPNVVYIDGDFDLDIPSDDPWGGFFVVIGNTTMSPGPGGGHDKEIKGGIYTVGDTYLLCEANRTIEIDGGLWSADNVTLVGDAVNPPASEIKYNQTYINAIQNLGITDEGVRFQPRLDSWTDSQESYPLEE